MPDVEMFVLEILVDHEVYTDRLICSAIEEIGRTITPGLHAAPMCGNAKVTPSDLFAINPLGVVDGGSSDPGIFL
ncbi:hypothetical protein D9M73_105020 [compost metagenome]|uniref:hypothetical protein n=1 Tax=Sphingomonas sp. TF3 TaxID=2495580 RepID=UPI0021AE7BEA|nr:hypothetical protein [Sphingomonas sp. TF3]